MGLLTAWGTAMSVDATLHRCMTSHHLKFKLAASLIMTNRESISLERFHGWVTRQMAVIRYTASETLTAIQIQIGILLLLHAAVPAMAVAAFLMGQPLTGAAALLSLAIYWLVHGLAMIMFEQHDENRDASKRGRDPMDHAAKILPMVGQRCDGSLCHRIWSPACAGNQGSGLARHSLSIVHQRSPDAGIHTFRSKMDPPGQSLDCVK